MTFSEKILHLRKSKGMSQEELAEKLDISRQAISRWEMGTAQPDVQNVIQIAKLFGVSTDYLIMDEKETEEVLSDDTTDKEIKQFSPKKLWFFIAICYVLASVCFLITGIDTLDIFHIILCLANIVLAIVFFVLSHRAK